MSFIVALLLFSISGFAAAKKKSCTDIFKTPTEVAPVAQPGVMMDSQAGQAVQVQPWTLTTSQVLFGFNDQGIIGPHKPDLLAEGPVTVKPLKITPAVVESQGKAYVEARRSSTETDKYLEDAGLSVTTAVARMRQRGELLVFELRTKSDPSAAVQLYRSIFEPCSVALSEMIKYMSAPARSRNDVLMKNAPFMIEALTQGELFKDVRPEVQRMKEAGELKPEEVLAIYDIVVGRTVNEFKYIRGLIARLEKEDGITDIFSQNIKYFKDKLSLDATSSKYSALDMISERQLLDNMYAAIDNRPGVLVAYLQLVSKIQRSENTRMIVRSILHTEQIRSLIYKYVPAVIREPVSRFFKMSYNQYVLQVHLKNINPILTAKTEQTRMDLFMVAMGEPRAEQMIETLVRLSKDIPVVMEIKKYFESKKDDDIAYKAIHEMILDAEKKVPKLGFISSLKNPSKFDNYAVWVLPAVGAGLTWAVIAFPDWWPHVQNIMAHFQQTPPAVMETLPPAPVFLNDAVQMPLGQQ